MSQNALALLDDDAQDVLADCINSTKRFCEVFHPERFYRPFSAGHDDIFAALDDDRIKKLLIVAPRNFGKSSISNFAFVEKRILFNYKENPYMLVVSETSTSAIEQSDNIKEDLLSNEQIVKFFGSVQGQKWSADLWETDYCGHRVRVLPRGAGQQIRGRQSRGKRPNLIVVDDLENAEEVMNEENRKKLRNWFYGTLLNAPDRADPNARIIVIGSVTHEDCLIARLMKDKNWETVLVKMWDASGKSLWPDYLSDLDIKKLIDEYREGGKLDTLYMEFTGEIVPGEDASFQQRFFKYYEDDKKFESDPDLINIVIIDPAKTVEAKSAYSAVVGIGVKPAGQIYIRDLVMERMFPNEMYDVAFKMATKIKARAIAAEVTSLNQYITYPMKTIMVKEGYGFRFIELNAKGKKEDRIGSLIPLYRKGMIYHNKGVVEPLEQQLLSYPRSAYLDAADATSYIVNLLDDASLFFWDESASYPKEWEEDLEDAEYSNSGREWRTL